MAVTVHLKKVDILKEMASPIGRLGQPRERGPAYIFLAYQDSGIVGDRDSM